MAAEPVPSIGALLTAAAPPATVVSYSYNAGTNTTSVTLNKDPGYFNVGDLLVINGKSLTIVSGDSNTFVFVVTDQYIGDITGATVAITAAGGGGGGNKPSFSPGGRVPEVSLVPTKENRVPEGVLTPDVRDVPRTELIPLTGNKGNLIPS